MKDLNEKALVNLQNFPGKILQIHFFYVPLHPQKEGGV